MIPRALLEELATVAQRDADAIRDDYAWPPRTLTDAELREAQRLETLSRRIWYRATATPGTSLYDLRRGEGAS